MVFYAHSENGDLKKHHLKNHLLETAKRAQSFCHDKKYEHLFYLTGLLHDVGKYQKEFQNYLLNGGRRGSVPHASLGAVLCKNYNHTEAAFAIDGHHKGLPDRKDILSDLDEYKDKDKSSIYKQAKSYFLADNQLEESVLDYHITGLELFERELFTRLLFSALTDADWLDTEKHFNNSITIERNTHVFDPQYLIAKLENEISYKNKTGYINELRNQVRMYAISKSTLPTGFFSMTLPTGMGKTLASVSWALHHARHNKLERIIIVLPFISIIDQTAKELKRIFGEVWVLEHHSNFNDDKDSDNNIKNEMVQGLAYTKRLATENWDYPIIVTTSVQFFESLFSNKPSKCRKIHNISRSVVIFDEIQTLPKELVYPTITMLQNVQKIMNTSFLFCTATQPAFEKRENFDGIKHIESLVDNPEEIFNATGKRVCYTPINDYAPITNDELCEQVCKQNCSSLVIFNTKKQAILFFNNMKKRIVSRIFHLSTSMYPAHRKAVIKKIRACLKNGEHIIVSSTQLIEAGVDFDFPCVFREIAPLESVIQSAGRCNREGSMNLPGKVFLFSIEGAGSPDKQYRTLAEFARDLYRNNEDLLFNHTFFSEYYRKAISLFVDVDKKKVNEARKAFNFKTAAASYRLIENETIPLFIICNESNYLYESIRYKPVLSRADYRAMQQYTVQVYDNFMKKNIRYIIKEDQGYLAWHGPYNKEFGLTDNPDLDILIL